MARVSGSGGGSTFGASDFDVFELPEYEPTPKPPSTPREFVEHALNLARRFDATDFAGQGKFLESTGTMHLQYGRTQTALLAYSTAERLFKHAQGPKGDPFPLIRFYERTAKNLRQYGFANEAAEYHTKYQRTLLG